MVQENILLTQIVTQFVASKLQITLKMFVIKVGEQIRWDGYTAYNGEGKVINPIVAGIYNKPPSPEKAWDDLVNTLSYINSVRKVEGKQELVMDKEGLVRLNFNNGLSNVINQFEELKKKPKKDEDDSDNFDDTTHQEPPNDRSQNFIPYSTERKNNNGEIVDQPDICNFNIQFKCILKVGDVLRTRCNINYIEEGTGEHKKIEDVEIDKITFHDRQLFTKFFAGQSNLLWYNKVLVNDLLTAINKDETIQKPFVVNKTQDFGWNKDFTKFLTPSWDYELVTNSDSEFMKDHRGMFVLRDHLHDYCEKHGIDPAHAEGEAVPKIEGSVKILNEKIKDSIKIGFRHNVDKSTIKNTIMHIKNTMMKMSSVIDRSIPIVFLAPLMSVLQEIDMSYQIYLQGKSGYGKSQISILYMNFFAEVESKDQLVNILRDKINAIEEVGFYHRNCLYILDNFKESAVEKREFPKLIALLQSIADGQGTRRMSKSDFNSFKVRGMVMVTSEESFQDASTNRKYDTIHIGDDAKISIDLLKECHRWKKYYSAVMSDYIQYLMQLYGNGIVAEIERRKTIYQKEFTNPLFALNMIGYSLFLDYFMYNGIFSKNEVIDMYKTHVNLLKSEEGIKEEIVESKMSSNRMIDAMRSGLISRQFSLINDPEYGNSKSGMIIGQTNREITEISFFPETYYLLKKLDSSLPDDLDSIWEQLKDNDFVKKQVVHRCDNKQKARLLVFNREYLIPTNISCAASMKEIADEIIGASLYQFKIDELPTVTQYHELTNHILRMLPTSKKAEKEKFLENVKILIDLSFKSRFPDWEAPK